jgi:hypothetical protein
MSLSAKSNEKTKNFRDCFLFAVFNPSYAVGAKIKNFSG